MLRALDTGLRRAFNDATWRERPDLTAAAGVYLRAEVSHGDVTSAARARKLGHLRRKYRQESGLGREFRVPLGCRYSRAEVLETLDVLVACGPGFELGWEAGILYGGSQRPQ
jgi:hypothetical protein